MTEKFRHSIFWERILSQIYKIINGFIKTDLRIYKINIVRIKTNFDF